MPEPCDVAKTSAYIPGHIHTCNGTHQDGMHKCPGCRRWFGVAL